MVVMNIIMLLCTVFIAWGLVRSMKVKNTFAVGFSAVSLAIFLFADYLILFVFGLTGK
ncbi:DUF2759 family protein [Brevibacillus dissolubilis]|uniref:DUF2759 family protein n=1 Tax=Brevibacillus dissolubilis TaxID=1844116 RepID=UPI0011160FFE|nr:DUF2759 family protein [Brevibacillus dissolubilis]